MPFAALLVGLTSTSSAAVGQVSTAARPDDARQAPGGRPAPLADDDLADLRGGQTIAAGNQTLTAITTGNVINGNYSSGSITLSDQALSGFNGVGNFAVNTGAQVSLQSALNLTVNVTP
ncbi:hypothetical protein [Sphingomonas bacterium]|uniref:hypothetical protein n=1 Tax=Sphingomonas bacterium TaxID=1895847 RepID=UPI0015772421|nr:hypothetical protein [Sphingomonas bacterium]